MRMPFVGSHSFHRAVIVLAIICVMGWVPLISGVQTQMTVTIVNSSSRDINHVDLSLDGADDWGPDQLSGAAIGNGGSYTLNNISCGASGVKVITEDQNGCFLYNTVTCETTATWTITDEATPDCGN